MTDKADPIPVDEQYLRVIGRATYNFAYLEWGIIWLGETVEPGFLKKSEGLTAGVIACNFIKAIGNLPGNTADLEALRTLAYSFKGIVTDRNRLLHGKPFTAKDGVQRLRYDGKHGFQHWEPELVHEFASRSAKASIEANRLLHNGRLNKPKQSALSLAAGITL